ncbi:MAG: hypothetical protein DCC58_04185 [Chloroflexi bacterium]|nr:MAG: hypothetical protein DCC58_04185 [Chloroflexota bacterium]
MWSFPTLEPAIVRGSSFVIERRLERAGDVEVRVGDSVEPHTVVARSGSLEKTTTVFVASELGIANDEVRRRLTRPIGSSFEAGEEIARVRRGLRTAAVTAPLAGVLTDVDDANGTVVLRASSASTELRALVDGVVERVIPDHGAIVRTSGSRVFGVIGFGGETTGRLVVGSDRHDRELTADQVRDTWKGTIVLTGMTVGVPTLQRLRQVGVAGIIVGSLAEADIRRFVSGSAGSEQSTAAFWRMGAPSAPFIALHDAPLVVIVTEGFGRIPMAEPVFTFLRQHEGTTISMQATTSVAERLSRPEIYIPGSAEANNDRTSDALRIGRPVRLIDNAHLGMVGVVADVLHDTVSVELPNGARRTMQSANLEVLT